MRIDRILLCLLVGICISRPCMGSTISTHLELEARALAGALATYAETHQGHLPHSWDELKNGIDFDRLTMRIGSLIDSRTILLPPDSTVTVDRMQGAVIVAMTAFPIHEDRTEGNGRYIVYRQENGRFAARWESEQTIQKALAAANVSVPPAAVYQERLLKPLNPEYGMKLIEDAIKHGVPAEEAAKAVEKHVDDVSNRRAKPATTWAEVAAAATAADVTPTPTAPLPPAIATASPQPATPVAQTSAPVVERNSRVWPWLAGIVALVAIIAFALKRRA